MVYEQKYNDYYVSKAFYLVAKKENLDGKME
jgi:hypothetical protein